MNMFIPPIELEYRTSDRQLMRFNGFSNLSASDDQKVNITFRHYTTEERLDRPLAQWLPEAVRDDKLVQRD
ncbi:MAG: hypothetical protein U5O39_05035 [Gammaproteobacteria bacterium]|nr:hypothetical protein [Gammaproteobacteria bacterium]